MRTVSVPLKNPLRLSDSTISLYGAWVLATLLSLLAGGCSRPYACYEADEREDARCQCSPARRSSSRSCSRKYDCCVEFTKGSILPDDPNSGYGCDCWMLRPGQTCESTSEYYRTQGSVYNVDSYPKSCPP
jgi:hypothetical protein